MNQMTTYAGEQSGYKRRGIGVNAAVTAGEELLELLEFPLQEFGIYRIDFDGIRCPEPGGLWVVDFFNASGEKNYADNYSLLYPSAERAASQTAFFMARAEAVRGTLGVRSQGGELQIGYVQLQTAAKDEALAWMDAVASEFPDIAPSLHLNPGRWRYLPRTLDKLKRGETIRVAALGDSISNDMLNGLGHLLVERAYPGAELQIVHANGPEKACDNYKHEEVLERLVTRHHPDLLTVGGMSHKAEDIRSVIRNVRRMYGDIEAVYFDIRVNSDPESSMCDLDALKEMAREDEFDIFDMTTPYLDCVNRSGYPLSWFSRDDEHANDRGKQLLARIFAAYFDAGS